MLKFRGRLWRWETVATCRKRHLLLAAAMAMIVANAGSGRADQPGLLCTLKGHKGEVRLMVFAPPGKNLLITSGADQTVRLWNTQTGKEITQLTEIGLKGPAKAVAWTPNATRVAIAYTEGGTALWDVSRPDAKMLRQRLPGSKASVLAFSPDGKLLAGASERGEVELYDMADQAELRTEPPPPKSEDLPPSNPYAELLTQPSQLIFSPDSRFLALSFNVSDPKWQYRASAHVSFFRISDGEPAKLTQDVVLGSLRLVEAVAGMDFVAGEGTVALILRRDGQLERYKIRRAGTVEREETGAVTLRDSGTELVAAVPSGRGRGFVTVQLHNGPILEAIHWDLTTGQAKKVAASPKVEPETTTPLVALASDGSLYAVTAASNNIEIYRTSNTNAIEIDKGRRE